MESKSEKLCNLLKNCNYPSKLNPNNLNYLFEFPDLKPFFEKFFSQINESCYQSREKLNAFGSKVAKGQVIYDLKKLQEMHKLLNLEQDYRLKMNSANSSDEFDIENCTDPTVLRKKIQLLEGEVRLKRRREKFNSFSDKKFTDNLKELRMREEAECRINAKLDEKEAFIKNSLKASNQSLNKSFIELKAKLGDEDRLQELGPNQDSEKIENYLVKENSFLNLVKKLMNLEIDCTNLNNLESKLDSDSNGPVEPTESELLEQKQFQIIMKRKFPKVMDKWIQMKIAHCSSSVLLEEISRIDNEFDQFFVYTEDELRQNENLVGDLERKLLEHEQERDAVAEKLEDLVRIMPNLINQLAYLKMVHLACLDLENKEINLNLFFNKQEKIFKLLTSQKTRIEFITHLQASKLNHLENFKHLFCELLESTTNTANKTFTQTNSILSTSNTVGPFSSMIQGNKNLSINQYSKPSLVSSTFNSSITNRFISSPSKQLTSKFNHDDSTSESKFKSAFSHNLSKINAKMSRHLENQMTKLNDQTRDLQNVFASQVYQTYSHLKQQLSSNKLINLRRNFFVHFYTNPKQIENIMEQLNSVY
ncbi:hypothetical protein BpHYR1_036764 [Brachionus plicatilis]|uniref:Uncharacterized protein n=1 Tax=Brachionus plicatilis TaxID=10195 RepID=A0A3M7SZG2_BRAPC|nr:hypothetical protein BpHYR1_036764 [Brachionus plicatilis]